VVGAQWGDEGKGRVVDLISEKFDIVARFQGGSNAGHTIMLKDKKIILHHVPCGVLRKNKVSIIGNGMVVDLETLVEEIKNLKKSGFQITNRNLKISPLAHLILPYHKSLDIGREALKGSSAIGTTGRGIGPAYEDKIARQGIRIIDIAHKKTLKAKLQLVLKEKNKILNKVFNKPTFKMEKMINSLLKNYRHIKEFVSNTEEYLNNQIRKNKKILFEGAQGAMLDIDFGTYPFVTSSSTIAGGASVGTGVPSSSLGTVVGISKAYTTRVGHGPFPTEMFDDQGLLLREFGTEYGATTGRPRRCGWLDLIALKHSIQISGIDSLVLTKVDVLSMFETVKVCVGYQIKNKKFTTFPLGFDDLNIAKPIYKEFNSWSPEELVSPRRIPKNLNIFIKFIESFLSTPISMISVGPERNQIIYL
jgi:adenylosuccinate synthase